MAQDPTIQHEELAPAGFDAFTDHASRLVLSGSSPLIEHRTCSIQTLGIEERDHFYSLLLFVNPWTPRNHPFGDFGIPSSNCVL